MKEVKAQIDLTQSPEIILKAFSDPDMLRGWWGVERSLIELKKGGMYMLAWQITEKGFGYISAGRIAKYTPGTELLITDSCYFNPERPILGPMEMHISLTTGTNSNALTVLQTGYQSGPDWTWYYKAVKDAWPAALSNLKKYLDNNFQV